MSQITNLRFEETVSNELPVLYRVARRLTTNPSDAEDLVGQVLLLAARSWAAFDGRHPRSWLLTILRNEQRSVIRSKAVRPQTVALEEASETVDCRSLPDDRLEVSSNIVNELDRLPEEYRLAVALCDMEEMSYQEAAIAMEVPVGTVRSRLYRGRQLLRERLGDLSR